MPPLACVDPYSSRTALAVTTERTKATNCYGNEAHANHFKALSFRYMQIISVVMTFDSKFTQHSKHYNNIYAFYRARPSGCNMLQHGTAAATTFMRSTLLFSGADAPLQWRQRRIRPSSSSKHSATLLVVRMDRARRT